MDENNDMTPMGAERADLGKSELASQEEVELPKIAEGSIEGQVSTIEGPMINATVSVGMNSALSDAKGNFLLEHVSPGIVKIRVKSTTSRFYDLSEDILVEADKKKSDVFLFLKEVTGTVEGKVVDENGEPLIGAEVSGLFRLGKDALVAKTDENGHFVFADVPRGSYYVRAKASGHMIEGISVNVTGGNTSPANFTLKSGNLTISGKVVNKAGSPIDCEIFLLRKGVVVTRVRTSSSGDGTFVFANLLPDSYEMSTSSAGCAARGWFGKVEKSEVVDFVLEPMPVRDQPPR